MSIRHLAGIATAALLATGCTKQESAATDTAAAAAAATGSTQVEAAPSTDSTVVADSTLPPPSDATGNLTGETRSRDPVIGRDSAFGPIGTMDSDGTVRPIRK